MNVTKHRYKGRKLRIDDYSRMAVVKQQKYAEVPVHVRIAEHNDIITDLAADSLLKKILLCDYMNNAYVKVKSHRGTGEVDKMSVNELVPYLKEHQVGFFQQIKDGTYKPSPVRRVEIPKEERDKFRKLEIPTVVDQIIQ